jgi:hypothetical protein
VTVSVSTAELMLIDATRCPRPRMSAVDDCVFSRA